MGLWVTSFWRAVAYCLHPRVIALSILPLVLTAGVSFVLGYLYWDAAVAGMAAWLEAWELVSFALDWLDAVGLSQLRAVIAPLMVLALVTPLIVVLSLLLVAWLMTPSLVDLVAQRRFPQLARRGAVSWWLSLGWSVGAALLAVLALIVSIPFWFIPPLGLILPPLVWGWLTYRVLAFDALAAHADREERLRLMDRHRLPLWIMGVACGYLGAVPSLLWVSGAMFVALAPLLVPLAVWVYALVFAFASLWFIHFLLTALERERIQPLSTPVVPAPLAPAGGEVVDVTARSLP